VPASWLQLASAPGLGIQCGFSIELDLLMQLIGIIGAMEPEVALLKQQF
jgi:hypothetical protein